LEWPFEIRQWLLIVDAVLEGFSRASFLNNRVILLFEADAASSDVITNETSGALSDYQPHKSVPLRGSILI
jgi:hypothetical protein